MPVGRVPPQAEFTVLDVCDELGRYIDQAWVVAIIWLEHLRQYCLASSFCLALCQHAFVEYRESAVHLSHGQPTCRAQALQLGGRIPFVLWPGLEGRDCLHCFVKALLGVKPSWLGHREVDWDGVGEAGMTLHPRQHSTLRVRVLPSGLED